MSFVPIYILILFLIILIDFFSVIAIEKSKGKQKRFYLIASLLSNILLLCFFKYFNFLNDNIVYLFSLAGFQINPINLNIVLPIGLSFHTFQSMSYTIEVYRGKQKAERHLGYFANYVLFFPQMVAGPIERYETLGNELKAEKSLMYENFSAGFRLILFGLMVKMTIADNIAPFVNEVYANPLQHSSLKVFGAIVLFSFQIYADFYGYSTIALGSARLLGISIMTNFSTPYLAKSISEFWTRWHISLSTWFRDYVYISLGGNKVSLPKWSINIMIVFLVSGLWHGASWTFVVWGALHGTVRLLEKYFSNLTGYKIKEGWSFVNVILTLKTFLITSFIWIFFRAENFEKVKDVLCALFQNVNIEFPTSNYLMPMLMSGFLVLLDISLYKTRFDFRLNELKTPGRWVIYAIFIFLLFAFSGTQKFNFIYFQF